MKSNSTDLITARIRKLKTGSVFTPKDFIDLSSHETVRKVLSRLTERGMIRRLIRGVYDRPTSSRLLGGPTPPAPDAIAQAIARAHGWTIVPSGAMALNILGLSTQVPAQWHYFSDGPTKRYRWDGGVLFLQHRTNKEVTGLSPKTALVVHALKALGKPNVDSAVIDHLRKALSKRDRLRALKEARYVTSWIYEIIKQLVAEEV